MEFKSLSATALKRAIDCPASFLATHVNYAASESGNPAKLGTAVHDALEEYVRGAYVDCTAPATLERLALCYRGSFQRTFGALDPSMPEWSDGLQMLTTWMNWKQDFSKFTVISLEKKEEFLVPLPNGKFVPFRYKFDREDRLDEKTVRVVDYKTQRASITHEDLKDNIQARCYGLAAQIRHKEAEKIWVQFDLLRHSSIGVVFTRQENADTWRMIKSKAAELHLTETPEERINTDCRYCVRKASCKTLQSNVINGGIESISSTAEMVDLRYKLEGQLNGVNALLEEIDSRMLRQADIEEALVFEGELAIAEITPGRGRRQITDRSEVHRILGSEVAQDYANFLIGDIDRMEKDPRISKSQISAIKKYVQKSPGKLGIKTKRRYNN